MLIIMIEDKDFLILTAENIFLCYRFMGIPLIGLCTK